MINTTRIRYVLVAATVLHLILLACLATSEFRHDVRLPFAGFAFFGTIAFTDYEAYFAVAFSLGIIVVPFIIDKSGFLNNYPDEPPDADLEGGYTNKEAEEHIDRLVGYIRNHTLSTGIVFSSLGTFMLCMLTAYLRDETAYNTGWQKELTKSFGHLNLPLLLLALAILVIGVALIGLYINRKRRAAN
jgi:hypothetical protein